MKKVHFDLTFNKKLKSSLFLRCHPDRREGTGVIVRKNPQFLPCGLQRSPLDRMTAHEFFHIFQ